MNIWTTFTPSKVSWELSCVKSKGESPSRDWQGNLELIEYSLMKLKNAGVSGIRLVIYPSEITTDGDSFDWRPIDTILSLSQKSKILVDLCIGPYQYPNYPGIYLPEELIKNVSPKLVNIDDDRELYKYGLKFLKEQMRRFGRDKRVRGFHLANEWPDMQKVEKRRELKVGVSYEFMLDAVSLLRSMTRKPVSLNTNIEINNKRRVKKVFGEIVKILSKKGKLGFDIYPSQDKWKKNPIQKMRNILINLPNAFISLQNTFPDTEIYFAEVEAQPWGSGQSWYRLVCEEENPDIKILNYYADSLEKTFRKYIDGSGVSVVSLWGSDFWLAADMMGVKWPLAQVKKLASIS